EIFDHLSVSRLNAESVVSRKDASALALEWWRVFPWRGVGLGGYGKLELEDKFQSQTDDYQPIVNNQYLETLVEMGVIGLVLFILFFGFVLVRSVQAWFVVDNNFDRATLAGLTIGIIAILAQYATFSTIYIVYVWVFTGLLIANQEKILSKNNKKDERLNSK
ncbi:O-antigen ligase family protein, partial [Patescibacteria group bacterium]|nr:O-antigen ligase family protein [Patescibacteria group bacterium]